MIILSDYGHWSFWWGYRGDYSVPAFLAKLDIGYMGGKMMGVELYEYSETSTVQAIREHVIDYRHKWRSMSKEAARYEWDLAAELESGEIDLHEWYSQTKLEDAYEFQRKEICSTWQCFWDRLWVPLVQPILVAEAE